MLLFKQFKQNRLFNLFKFNFLSHKASFRLVTVFHSFGVSVVKKKINAFLWHLIDFEPRDSVIKRLLYTWCCFARVVLQLAFRGNRRQEAYRLCVVLPSRETPPSFAAPKCLCVLKHIAGVHKVYLGEYTDARTRQRRENIMRSTRERRDAEQENIDKILLRDRDGEGGWRAVLLLFFEYSLTVVEPLVIATIARATFVTTWRESKSTISACANFFFAVNTRIVFRVTFWE